MQKQKIIAAVSGASGSILAKTLINILNSKELSEQISEVSLVFSDAAKTVWKEEIGEWNENIFPFKIFNNNSFYAPFASGSNIYDTMIICPCSMGMLGRIANGISNDLISRAADVILKERKKLIAVVRETPLNLIHLKNMKKITKAGGIVFPATPAFYIKNDKLIDTIENLGARILQTAGFKTDFQKWLS